MTTYTYTFAEYQRDAARTMADVPDDRQVLVYLAGLAGETGEVAELLKKHIGHGHPLDREALKKELGDVLWYLSALASTFGLHLDEVASANVEKLRRRLTNGFSREASQQRADTHSEPAEPELPND